MDTLLRLLLIVLGDFRDMLTQIKGEQMLMANRVEDFKTAVLAALDAANTTLDKVAAEEKALIDSVANLTALLAASQTLTPEEQAALADVQAAVAAVAAKATAIDDQVPDAPPTV